VYIDSAFSGIDHNNDGTDDDIYLYHRFDALGTRDDDVDGSVYDVLGGFKGNVGPVGLDFGARYNEYKTYILGKNYVVLPIALQFMSDGSYNFVNPNTNPANVLNSMKATINRESTWKTQELWGTANMDLFKLAGGMAGMAVGGEFSQAEYFDQYDSLSEGGVIGGSAGNSSGKNRIVRGLFVELGLPVLDNLEATVAARYDDYSDVGGQVSPKLSVGYQPLDILKLRAAYGQGFRAPTLDVISLLPSFSAEPVVNDQATCLDAGGVFAGGTCSVSVQVNTTIIANPALDPEESDQYSFGFVVDPLDNVNVSLDYYSYKITGLISYISPSDLIDFAVQGVPFPPGLSVTRDAANGNRIDQVIAGYANRGELKTSGLNLDANVNFDLGAMGRVSSNLQAAMVMNYAYDGGRDLVGDPGVPEMRSNLFNSYTFRSYSAAWNVNHIGDQFRSVNGAGVQSGHIGSYITHDVQFNYEHPWNGMISVGAQNVFDKRVPVNPYDGRPYNFYLYEAYGAVPYVRYTQRF
jgi:iron complex outermembrane receptor protein